VDLAVDRPKACLRTSWSQPETSGRAWQTWPQVFICLSMVPSNPDAWTPHFPLKYKPCCAPDIVGQRENAIERFLEESHCHWD
jgi:hypothetical protein